MNARVGAVLVGGSSRRMGRDKATLILPDGTRMVDRPIEALREAGCRRIASIGRTIVGLEDVDDAEGWPQGPVSGVVAAIRWAEDAGAEDLLIAPCDVPHLQMSVLQGLLEAGGSAIWSVEGRLQPLIARLHLKEVSLPKERLSAAGSLMIELGCMVLEWDGDPRPFTNVNDPRDLDSLAPS